MFTRRDFAFLLGGAACAPPSRAADCIRADLRKLGEDAAALTPDPVISPGPFVAETGPQTVRPLWSRIRGTPEGELYADTLTAAYKEMKALCTRNKKDPRGILYQGRLHWIQCCRRDRCAHVHGHSGFLPWHRAYLYYFERLIQKLASRPQFRLAAWDWEVDRAVPSLYNDNALLPLTCAYFRETNEVDPADVTPVSLSAWLQTGSTRSKHFMGTALHSGSATQHAHGNIHLHFRALMGDIELAAFDPLFFAHHANIDRFWDHWYQTYKDQPNFFDGQDFPAVEWTFFDALTERYVIVKPSEMYRVADLGYSYIRPEAIMLFDHVPLTARPSGLRMASFPVESLREFRKVLPKGGKFSLPVVATLSLPHNAAPGRYSLALQSGTRTIWLARFAVVSPHTMDDVHAFGGVTRDDLAALTATGAPFRTLLRPAIPGAKVRSLEVQYPRSEDIWRRLPG